MNNGVNQDELRGGNISGRLNIASGPHVSAQVRQQVVAASQGILHQSEDVDNSIPPENMQDFDQYVDEEAAQLAGTLPPDAQFVTRVLSSRLAWLDMRVISVMLFVHPQPQWRPGYIPWYVVEARRFGQQYYYSWYWRALFIQW